MIANYIIILMVKMKSYMGQLFTKLLFIEIKMSNQLCVSTFKAFHSFF